MTDLLQKAFDEVSRLPEEKRDQFARWMLEILADDEKWDAVRSKPGARDLMEGLADDELADHPTRESGVDDAVR